MSEPANSTNPPGRQDQSQDTQIKSSVTGKRSTRDRKLSFRVGALILGILLSLLTVEILVRLFKLTPPALISKKHLVDRSSSGDVYYHCYPDNPHGEFEPLPDLTQGDWELSTYTLEPKTLPIEQVSKTPWCVKYEHSFKGIRDRDYPEFPPKDVLRIVCVGDSFVFGEGVPVEKTLVRQLDRLAGKSVEIINGGQMGFDTLQELEILNTIAHEGHCTRGIFVFIPNDIAAGPLLARRQKYINDLVQIRDVYLQDYKKQNWHGGHLKSFQLLSSSFAMDEIKRETIQWYLDLYDPRHNQDNLRILKEAIQHIPQVPNCRTVFIIYPLLESFETGYPLQSIHDQVQSIAQQAGLPVFDLLDAFRGQKTSDLWVHPTDHHPNGTAHQIAAQAIYKWLKKDVPGFLE